MKIKIIIDRTFFDSAGKEIQWGDILEGKRYPYYREEENTYNYYGIVLWSKEDEDVVIRTTVGDNDIVSGISDGNCEYIKTFANDDKILEDFTVVGNVANQNDVNKYLREKDWCIEDCDIPKTEI